MHIARNRPELDAHIKRLSSARKCEVAFIPTMGALHAGHLSLIDLGRKHANTTIVSIFVNPTQFGKNEGFGKYPRPEEHDLKLLADKQVDLVYLPTVADLYPHGPRITIKAPEFLADTLCGIHRPGHFDGVATVVKTLFDHIMPDVAVFGEKDYQQLQIIRWLVTHEKLPIEIIPGPILRESDGLAMSSRNVYLSPQERKLAPKLYETLISVKKALLERGKNPEKQNSSHSALSTQHEALLEAGFSSIDYLELRDAETLAPFISHHPHRPARLLAAAWLGKTRLIDNIPIP